MSLTPDERDVVRAAAAKVAASALGDAMKRHGATAEVLSVAAEGALTGIANLAWRNRAEGVTPERLERMLRDLLRAAVREATK